MPPELILSIAALLGVLSGLVTVVWSNRKLEARAENPEDEDRVDST